MWKSGIAAGFIDILAVNKMLKRGDLVIHTIHGEMWNTALSTFPPQDKTFYFHKVIHALIVHNEGVALSDLLNTVNQFV